MLILWFISFKRKCELLFFQIWFFTCWKSHDINVPRCNISCLGKMELLKYLKRPNQSVNRKFRRAFWKISTNFWNLFGALVCKIYFKTSQGQYLPCKREPSFKIKFLLWKKWFLDYNTCFRKNGIKIRNFFPKTGTRN